MLITRHNYICRISQLQLLFIELMDEVQVAACNKFSKLTLKETPLLLLEFHGSKNSVEEQAKIAG